MKETQNKFAIILDEYGGVEGIVTFYDILEQIVGDFNSNDTNIETNVILIDDNKWEVNGSLTIEEANEILGTSFVAEENDTLSGFVFSEYGKIPFDGEQFETNIDNLKITVVKIKDHKIDKMIIEKTT